MAQKKKVRALAMLSGGLDSLLVIKLLQEQDIEVTALNFSSVFFPNEHVIDRARKFGIKLITVNITENKDYLKMVKEPKYGHGAGINPCVDCKIFMLKEAKKIMKKEGFDFIATGEVLNERPMSQTGDKLKLIEEESGLKGYLLRPLSAKVLEETIPEKKGLVDRNKLLGIKGRGRKEQIALALKYDISDYPSPAGGCILCEKPFESKLKDLFKHKKINEINYNELALLKLGRHFRIGQTKFIVGRNKEENDKLALLKKPEEFIFHILDIGSPIVLVQTKKLTKKETEIAAKLTAYYSNSIDKNIAVSYWNFKNESNKDIISVKIDEKEMAEFLKDKVG